MAKSVKNLEESGISLRPVQKIAIFDDFYDLETVASVCRRGRGGGPETTSVAKRVPRPRPNPHCSEAGAETLTKTSQ